MTALGCRDVPINGQARTAATAALLPVVQLDAAVC